MHISRNGVSSASAALVDEYWPMPGFRGYSKINDYIIFLINHSLS